MREKGKGLATVIPEESLSDKLSSNPKLDRAAQTRIGDQLRAMYDDLMQQPVPDRFKDLLDQLEKRRGQKGEKP
jgi:anti-sigma factor NepR-like protein